jgi:hypothetical protein
MMSCIVEPAVDLVCLAIATVRSATKADNDKQINNVNDAIE